MGDKLWRGKIKKCFILKEKQEEKTDKKEAQT